MDLTTTKVRLVQYLLLAIAIFLSYYLAKVAFRVIENIYDQYFADVITLQNNAFGRLPPLKIESLAINSSNPPTYVLNLTDSNLNFPNFMYVYETKQSTPSINNESAAKQIATNLGFEPDAYVKENSATFKYTDLDKLRQFTINVVNKNFVLFTSLNRIASEKSDSESIKGEDAISIAKRFLLSNNILLANELDNAVYRNIPTSIFADSYQEQATFSNDVKLQKVIINRVLQSPIGLRNVYFPILNEAPDDSNIYLIVGQEERNNNDYLIAEAKVDKDLINYESRSPYPLSDPLQIWEQRIKRGQAPITQLTLRSADHYKKYDNSLPLTIQEVEIREIELTYFESRENQGYIQPIYVYSGRFELLNTASGDINSGTIVIYYPAVSGEWVAN